MFSFDSEGNKIEFTEGMVDPRIGGESLTVRRQASIHAVMRLMNCTHKRGDNCDHVEAIRLMAEAVTDTALAIMVEAVRTLPRPLQVRDIERLAGDITIVSAVAADRSEERREWN